jgi:SAM-dependent MidA family methyltransferase
VNAAPEKLQFLLDLQQGLGGCVPFDRWMHEALYHPKFGYYTANIRGIGRRGDFVTWPALNDSLGRAIARWILRNKPPGRLHVVEIGAGSGELGASVIKALGWLNRARYHIVEISPRLRQAQQERLGSRAIWHASVAEALTASRGVAMVVSNELVDAFPCRVFQHDREGWVELALRVEEGRVIEEWISRPLPNASAFKHSWPLGQRVEVGESFGDWRRNWLPGWRAGHMLTIDYGDRCPALYLRRPRGTLRAYGHHQRLEGRDVYAGFGLRDLTADVNFTDLQSEPALSTVSFGTLSAFLTEYDPTWLKEDAARVLDAPGGAGEAFKVLVQTR